MPYIFTQKKIKFKKGSRNTDNNKISRTENALKRKAACILSRPV